MKLIYCTSLSFPSGLANRLQTLAMAREFTRKMANDFYFGVGNIKESEGFLDKYKDLKIINFKLQKAYKLAWEYLKFIKKNNIQCIYCREPKLLTGIIFYNKLFFHLKINFYYEMHELSERSIIDILINKFFIKKSNGIIFLTKYLENLFIQKYKYQNKSLTAPDGVDLKIFDLDLSIEESRSKLNISADKKIIGFFGRFQTMGMDKGLNIILKILGSLPEQVFLLAMGGKPQSIEYYQTVAQNLNVLDRVMFVEHLNQNELALRQKVCDILLMPFPYTQHYAYYMSPLKMFEYMASQRPIIATDLPSIKEVLNENNSILIKPDNEEELVQAINKLLNNSELAHKLAQQAYQDVQEYTWEKRAEKILEFIHNF